MSGAEAALMPIMAVAGGVSSAMDEVSHFDKTEDSWKSLCGAGGTVETLNAQLDNEKSLQVDYQQKQYHLHTAIRAVHQSHERIKEASASHALLEKKSWLIMTSIIVGVLILLVLKLFRIPEMIHTMWTGRPHYAPKRDNRRMYYAMHDIIQHLNKNGATIAM